MKESYELMILKERLKMVEELREDYAWSATLRDIRDDLIRRIEELEKRRK